MDETRRGFLQEIREQNRAIMMAAADERWEEVAALQGRRKILLREVFSPSLTEAESAAVAACCREVQDLDRRLMAHARDSRKTMGARLDRLKNGHAAQRAYQRYGESEVKHHD